MELPSPVLKLHAIFSFFPLPALQKVLCQIISENSGWVFIETSQFFLNSGDIVVFNVFYEIFTVCTSIVAEDKAGKDCLATAKNSF